MFCQFEYGKNITNIYLAPLIKRLQNFKNIYRFIAIKRNCKYFRDELLINIKPYVYIRAILLFLFVLTRTPSLY